MANVASIIIFVLIWLPTEAILTLTGSNSYIESNEDFVLNCFTDEDPSITRAFIYKDNVQIVTLTFQQGNCYGDATPCSVSKICDCSTRDYTWTFNGVIQNQPVVFGCRMQFPGITLTWKNSTLRLFLPTIPTSYPAVTIDPSGPIYNEGAVTMTCVVKGGIPLPTTSWQCPEPSVETLSHHADKTISTVKLTVNKTHNGKTCICEAKHPLWETTKSAAKNIVVFYDPESVTLSPSDTQYKVTEGSNVPNINCTADCIPACTYIWSGPGVPTGTTNVLRLKNINQYQSGVFNCTAYNVVGRSKSFDLNIDVQFGPGSTVQFEPSVTSVIKIKEETIGPITCSARCNPPCQYTWTKPDTTVVYGAQLIITSISIMDHGEFICTASNTIGDSHKRLDVTVNFKPFLDTTRPYSPSHISATENNILQITLAIKSNPLPAIEWRFKAETDCNFNSIVSNTTTNGFLTSSSISIEKVQSSDLGDYIFTANNTFGIFFRRFVVIKQASKPEPCAQTQESTGIFVVGIVTLFVGLLSLSASVIFVVRNSFKNKIIKSSISDKYTGAQKGNPAFIDEYTTIQSEIESGQPQEKSSHTYEECGRKTEANPYRNVNALGYEAKHPQDLAIGINTYEECGKNFEPHAYDTLDK